jgi:hypothetical protein
MFPNLNELPKEMQDVSIRLNQAVRRWRKAQDQLRLWEKEFKVAEQLMRSIEREYGELSLRWNPETNEIAPLESAPV